MRSSDNVITRSIRLLHYYPRSVGWIVSRLLLLTILISVVLLVARPSYRATCTMTTLPSGFELIYTEGRKDVQSALGPAMALTQTHTEHLLSRTIAGEVVDELVATGADLDDGNFIRHYVMRPFMRAAGKAVNVLNYGRIPDISPRESAIRRLRARTGVNNVPGSFILEISVTWPDPKIAADAANLITEKYVAEMRRSNRTEMHVTREFLTQSIRNTSRELNEIDEQIQSFKDTRDFYTGEKDIVLTMEEMTEYLRDARKTEAGIEEVTDKLKLLQDYQSPTALVPLRATLAGLTARKRTLDKSLETIETRLDFYPSLERQLIALYRERAEKEAALEILQQSLTKTEIAEASQINTVKIIDPAVKPPLPSRPRLLHNGVAAIMVGLILSVAFVTGMEHMRRYVRAPEDLNEVGIRPAGVIPFFKSGNRGKRVPTTAVERIVRGFASRERKMHRKTKGRRRSYGKGKSSKNAVTFHNHLDHLMVRLADEAAGKPIVFTSMDEEQGKSFLIEHLARRAAEAGRKVLVVDANLVDPTLHQAFNTNGNVMFADVLSGRANLTDAIVHVDPRIDLIPSDGKRGVGQDEAWQIDSVGQQLEAIREPYDMVLMDAASLRTHPMVTRLWTLSRKMVCVFDATTSTQSDAVELSELVKDRGAEVNYVLNYVKYPGDYLYQA